MLLCQVNPKNHRIRYFFSSGWWSYNQINMKRVIFIGQAMPRFKRDPHDWPTLNAWLFSLGITLDQIRQYFLYSALVDYFPGYKGRSHRVPTEREIQKDRPRLHQTIHNFQPQIVVPIGKLSISFCLNQSFTTLNECVGQKFAVDPYLALGSTIAVIPLPHPSGASTWRHKQENTELLAKALNLLKKSL